MQYFFAKFNESMKSGDTRQVNLQKLQEMHEAQQFQHQNRVQTAQGSTASRPSITHGNLISASNNPNKTENSFTRKLKENRQAFHNQKSLQ